MKIFKKSYWRFKRETTVIYNLVIATEAVDKNCFLYVPNPKNVKDEEDLLRIKLWMNRTGLIFVKASKGYQVMWFKLQDYFYQGMLEDQRKELEKEKGSLIERKRGLRRESGVIDE